MLKHTDPSTIIPCLIPTSKKFKNLTGLKFGLIHVICFAGKRIKNSGNAEYFYHCRCSCGTQRLISGVALTGKKRRGCRCWNSDLNGMRESDEYRIWSAMWTRCTNPRQASWKNYGGRGITVCERWEKFEHFFADMGQRPTRQHTIDRRDNDAGYSPDNCRWITRREQNRNRSDNHRLTFRGETKTIAEWSEDVHIEQRTIWWRISSGWSVDRALTTPILKTWSRHQPS